MEIRINVINEMKKLRSNVYADKYTWIDELIQNTQRSDATTVNVTVTDNKVIVEDDGVGCTDPEMLFIKNTSGWNETVTANENPFGEGFFSTIVAFNRIEVESVGFNAVFDVNKMFAENNVDVVDITPNRRKKGFKVILTDWLEGVRDYRIEYQFREVAKYIKNPKIYVNGNRVKYEGINPANIDKPFVCKVDNEYFRGWIRPHSWRCDWDNAEIKCFAFDRVVKDSNKFSGVAGVLNFKPNKIDLRSPDRKEFIFNEKYEDACNALLKEIRKMYIKVVKNGSDEQIKNYETSIDKYTSLNDYKKLIRFKFVTNKTAKAVVTDNGTTDTNNNTANTNNVYATKKITGINDTTYNSGSSDFESTTSVAAKIAVTASAPIVEDTVNQTGDRIDGRSDFGFYVKSDEVSNYTDTIAIAEYYNIPIIEIRNCLEDNVIRTVKRFKHISELSDSIQLNCKYHNTTPANANEIRILKLLNKITEEVCGKTNLFVIGDTTTRKILDINGVAHTIEEIDAVAIAYKGKIYLNRKHLVAKDNLNNTNDINSEDIKFVMLNLETICHEMSHALYDNEDNTKSHFTTIIYLMQKITNFVFEYGNKPIYI